MVGARSVAEGGSAARQSRAPEMRAPDRRTAARNNIAGVLWMCLTVLCFMAMAVAGRQLSDTMSTAQIMVLRSFVGLLATLPLALAAGPIGTRRPLLHFARNGIHFIGQYAWFYGIAVLSFVDVSSLMATTPIWATMFAIAFLGERAGFRRWAVVALGFVGVLVILRPHAVSVDWAALVCIFGAAGYAGANVLSKQLMRTDTPIQIVFYMMVIQLPIATLANWGQWTPVAWEDAGWIAIVGLTGVLAHLTMNQSIRLGDISVVVPVTYIQLPLLGTVGFIFYSEMPEMMVLVGACMIVAGAWWNIAAESRIARGH